MSGTWQSPRPFSGKEDEDLEAFLLDFDIACDANGWVEQSPLHRTRGPTTSTSQSTPPFVPLGARPTPISGTLYESFGRDSDQADDNRQAGIDSHKKLLLLKRSLRGGAARFLLSLPRNVTQNLDALVYALWDRYLPAEAQYVHRAQLRVRQRRMSAMNMLRRHSFKLWQNLSVAGSETLSLPHCLLLCVELYTLKLTILLMPPLSPRHLDQPLLPTLGCVNPLNPLQNQRLTPETTR